MKYKVELTFHDRLEDNDIDKSFNEMMEEIGSILISNGYFLDSDKLEAIGKGNCGFCDKEITGRVKFVKSNYTNEADQICERCYDKVY